VDDDDDDDEAKKGFGIKWSWPNWCTLPAFAQRNWGRLWKSSGKTVPQLRFELGTKPVKIYSITASPSCWIMKHHCWKLYYVNLEVIISRNEFPPHNTYQQTFRFTHIILVYQPLIYTQPFIHKYYFPHLYHASWYYQFFIHQLMHMWLS